ncbi:lipocalin-like domain-containing protein [[Hallella] seregens]|uniref:Lipocalin-like domain-containing protein n=1 Tax=Hallella seregens ATCC 51272 TaxID=1336250 RepID=A0ABV5ZNP9_9BACT|nr:lipocalin-like domain-containing protein [Hallella seregens]
MKIIGKALGLLLAALNVAACGDLIETTDDGRLGGNWLLTTVDTLATGGVADVHTDRKFMAVEGGILQLRDADEGKQYIFRYSYVDDKLTLSDARVNDRERGDPLVTDSMVLVPFGFDSLQPVLRVEAISRSRLTLVSDRLRLYYRKF